VAQPPPPPPAPAAPPSHTAAAQQPHPRRQHSQPAHTASTASTSGGGGGGGVDAGGRGRDAASPPPARSGAIFLCNAATIDECLGRELFGQPGGAPPRCEPHTSRLFLFQTQTKMFYGPFRCLRTGYSLDAHAWGGGFPAQVRVYTEGSEIYECTEESLRAYLPYTGEKKHFDKKLTGEAAKRLGERMLAHGRPLDRHFLRRLRSRYNNKADA
jgi:hypothetical protein